jgi:hypothetical protein
MMHAVGILGIRPIFVLIECIQVPIKERLSHHTSQYEYDTCGLYGSRIYTIFWLK